MKKKEITTCPRCGSEDTVKSGRTSAGSQLIACRSEECPSDGRPFTPSPKGAGSWKAARLRKRTTVSLWPEVWDLLDSVGPTRGQAIEMMVEFWEENKK